MRVLTVPNWSFGRDRRLLTTFRDALDRRGLDVHFLESDIDHNRTVSAFSGPADDAAQAIFDLCALAFPSIDLNRHTGVHPRVGALDVCPFVPLDPLRSRKQQREFREWVEGIASRLAEEWKLPVFLYEKSERGRHEADLPSLRLGGFGGLIGKDIEPDFGPRQAHPHLGATVLGWREFVIAFNVNLRHPNAGPVRQIAQDIRTLRREGDERFLGVRALGLLLATREMSQVSIAVTLPDLTPVDPIIEEIERRATDMGLEHGYNELIGVIRDVDLPTATRLHPRREQVIHMEAA